MTDQGQGDLQPTTTTPQPASQPQGTFEQRRAEQSRAHTPPPAQRGPAAPNPNAPRPADWDRSAGAEFVRAAEARRAAAGQNPPGDNRPPADPAAGADPRTDEAELNRLIQADAAERVRKLTLPQKPEDLPLELPKDFTVPAGIEFKLDPENPILPQAKAFALRHGLTKEAWSELLALSGASAVAAAQQRKTFVEGEIAKLGVNGTPRVTAISDFLRSYFGDDTMVLSMLPTTARAVEGWEKIIRERQTQGAGNYPGGNREPPPARTEIAGYDGMTFAERRAAQSAHRR
jgi:hypothetical protein